MTDTYQLKVTLRGATPPIWRRLLVPGNLTLERLHRVIQDAMGWEDCHLHSFEVGGVQFGPPDRDGWREIKSERQHTLEHLVGVKAKFQYVYDFGDNWIHQIVVEKVTPGALAAPRCLDGARACPPEDCGGVWAYAEIVAALLDDKHARHEELSEWVPEDWAPERFDLELADKLVSRHRPQPGRSRASKSRPSRTRA